MVGLAEYTSRPKETWRGWQWNRIAERLAGDSKAPSAQRRACSRATALYLCGPEDIDRQVALGKGFRTENLVAVDLDEASILRVREGGGIGVCARLEELLVTWPADWPIDVVVADTCTGFSASAIGLFAALVASPGVSDRTVVSVNLQRGRDKDTTEWREKIGGGLGAIGEELPKHRGHEWLMGCNCLMAAISANRLPRGISRNDVMAARVHGLLERQEPVTQTYRNSKRSVRMDSVVFRFGLANSPECNGLEAANALRQAFAYEGMVPKPYSDTRIARCRRRLAALRAVRTRRAG